MTHGREPETLGAGDHRPGAVVDSSDRVVGSDRPALVAHVMSPEEKFVIMLVALRSIRRQCDRYDVRRQIVDRALERIGIRDHR